jgi:hypothetical protein
MAFEVPWMRPHAPYMPIATAGLLAVLEESGHAATAQWAPNDHGRLTLRVGGSLDADAVGELIARAPWPQEDAIRWPGGGSRGSAQALKPLLKTTPKPLECFRAMVAAAPPLEAALLRALITDGALDADGLPSRSRLLRGVKSDLTSVFKRPRRVTGEQLAAELRDGLAFRSNATGLGLGLVPEVQTFGGSTGPDPSSIDAYSALLYLLLWRGIIALPPIPVVRGLRRTVGGPLVTGVDVLSWPVWRIPVGLSALSTLFMVGEVHADEPDLRELTAYGIDAVYRSRAVEINTMIAVFRWGLEVGR